MHENTSAGAAGFDLSPAEKTRMGLPVMAPPPCAPSTPPAPVNEVERLRALLLEGAAHLDQVRTTTAGIKWVEGVRREFGPGEPAPLPYRVLTGQGGDVVDANDRLVFSVIAQPNEAKATAEFIARACSSFPELVRVAREGLKLARYHEVLVSYRAGHQPPPAPIMAFDQARAAAVIEVATGEKQP